MPKLESWQEARLVGTLLRTLEAAVGIPRGSIKIKMLNERAEFALQQEAIEWVLRENLIGPNVGRWDYINSREDMFHHDPAMVFPNPPSVTMTEPSMSYYTRRNALLALLAGAMPIGGMAAQMQNPRAPEHDNKALRDIWFDKLRERLTGLFLINGKMYDTYRQSWVATITPAYVAAGRFDGFWEQHLKPWDVAAGALIVEEAGGKITDIEGQPYVLGGSSILASNGLVHDEMVKFAADVARRTNTNNR